MSHSTHDTLINQFLDARWLLQETRSALACIAEDHSAGIGVDAGTLRDLHREIDAYLTTIGGSRPEAPRPPPPVTSE
jgi:hypothetical protein